MSSVTTPGAESSFESSKDSSRSLPSAFLSTYNREYKGSFGPPAPDARVRTSRFYPPGQPSVDSTYRTDFLSHQGKPTIKVPYGTSSGHGDRSNNPHPHNMEQVFAHPIKDYFVWSHYRKLPPVNSKGTESSTSSELLKKVCQDKTRSTYQQDYVPHIQDIPSTNNGAEGQGLNQER